MPDSETNKKIIGVPAGRSSNPQEPVTMTVTSLPKRTAPKRDLLEIVDDLRKEADYAEAISLAVIGVGADGSVRSARCLEYPIGDHIDRLKELAADLDAHRMGGAS
jgi:hypothetical protein